MFHKVLHTPIDHRLNIHDIKGPEAPKIQKLAEAVACMVFDGDIEYDPKTNHYKVDPACPTLEDCLKQSYGVSHVGSGVRFTQEKQVGYGTAFLIGKRVALTAAHCVCVKKGEKFLDKINEQKVAKSYLVFSFFAPKPGETKDVFPKRDVYRINKVIQHQYSRTNLKWADWALLLLDREVEGRVPFSLDFSPLQLGTPLYMLGHPTGISQKFTYGATIKENKEKLAHEDYFSCDLDAFGGNSGSPVIREDTHEVIGMLCVGSDDYTTRTLGGTSFVDNNFENPASGILEKCQAMTLLQPIHDYLRYGLLQVKAPPNLTTPGLYLEVKCKRKGCTAFGVQHWIALGIQKQFNIREEASKATCHVDGLMSLTTLRVGMWQCHFKIEGLIKQPEEKSILDAGKAQGAPLWVISDDFGEKWGYLLIETRTL